MNVGPNNNNTLFVADSQTISQAQSNNTRAQKWLAVAHYRIGVCTLLSLIGGNHFNSDPTITSSIHNYKEIQ